MKNEFSNYCKVLGVSEKHTQSDLKRAYHALIRTWHPDKFHSNEKDMEEATEKCKLINLSYDFLSEYPNYISNFVNDFTDKTSQTKSNPPGNQYGRTKPNRTKNRDEYRAKHTYKGEEYNIGFPDCEVVEVFIKSSFIISTGYDRKIQVLYMKLAGNRLYKYYNVPETTFDDFLSASSHGEFANKCIFYKFKCDAYVY